MKFPKHILSSAQEHNNSCTELVRNLEFAASFTPALQVIILQYKINYLKYISLKL